MRAAKSLGRYGKQRVGFRLGLEKAVMLAVSGMQFAVVIDQLEAEQGS
jgi:hypothetical protein